MNKLLLTVLALAAGVALTGCATAGPTGMTDTGDEEFGVLLMTFSSSTHIDAAQYYKRNVEAEAGWKNVFIISVGSESGLFWGKYLSPDAAAANIRIAKNWKTSKGHTPFAKAMLAPLPGRDIGPADHNLRNVKDTYSVLVAVFFDVPQKNFYGRRQRAVDYAAKLRREGHEAYFYHGQVRSAVTIGHYGVASLQAVPGTNPVRFEMLDSGMRKVRAAFPNLLVNGHTEMIMLTNAATGKPEPMPAETYPFRIPSAAGGDEFRDQGPQGPQNPSASPAGRGVGNAPDRNRNP